MRPIRTIVAAVDLSETTREVLAAASILSKQLGAKLHVVHVVHDLGGYMGFYLTDRPMPELQRELEEEARAKLEQHVGAALGETGATVAVIRGTPFSDLVEYVREREGDLLVIGAHGHDKPEHRLFGSTAERLVKQSPCPVLVVGQR